MIINNDVGAKLLQMPLHQERLGSECKLDHMKRGRVKTEEE